MRQIAHAPHVNAQEVEALGVILCDLDTVLAEADFLVVNCPLNETTRGLISRSAFAVMKPSAFLINTARGHIVDERALYEVLQDRRIAGAASWMYSRKSQYRRPTRCSPSTTSSSRHMPFATRMSVFGCWPRVLSWPRVHSSIKKCRGTW
jgi:lactate dehydrogenase-like 2-hydroxyacid dehydrogenase